MPVQSENINFIPDKIVNERRVKHTNRVGVRVSIVVLVAVSLAGAGIFYYNYTISQKINKYKEDTKSMEQEIQNLKSFGEEGYKLGVRLENSDSALKERALGSAIMQEVKLRLPDSVTIQKWTYNPSQGLTMNAVSRSTYLSIDLFRDNLLAKNDMGEASPFKNVKLTNALYDKNDGYVEFTILIDVDISLLVSKVSLDEINGSVITEPEPEPTTEPTL